MKSCKETQTAVVVDQQPADKPIKAVEMAYLRFSHFDPSCAQDKAKLMDWCKRYWRTIFLKSLQNQNVMHYHECCTSFSRRSFVKLAGHPALHSSSLLRIPSFKEVLTAEDFYYWLLKLLTDRAKAGLPCRFPAINRAHIDETDEPEELKVGDDRTFLQKRVDELQVKLEWLEERLTTADYDKQKLLRCAHNWYEKYQEAADQGRSAVPLEFQTPQKVKPKCSLFFEEDS